MAMEKSMYARLRSTPHRARMQAVGRRDTDVELRLRRALWNAGLRYRTHRCVANTTPDIVFGPVKVAVFVDGCFWHGCPRHYVAPVANVRFWRKKLQRTKARDLRDGDRLAGANWRMLRFWQCEINHALDAVVNSVRATVFSESPYESD